MTKLADRKIAGSKSFCQNSAYLHGATAIRICSAQCRQTGSLAFSFSYRHDLLLVETGIDLALIALPFFRWLQVNEPLLLAFGNDERNMPDAACSAEDEQLALDLADGLLGGAR